MHAVQAREAAHDEYDCHTGAQRLCVNTVVDSHTLEIQIVSIACACRALELGRTEQCANASVAVRRIRGPMVAMPPEHAQDQSRSALAVIACPLCLRHH